MSGPKRIQRKRTKGWRMPEGAVSVCRPSIWGNPFTAHDAIAIAGCQPPDAQEFVVGCFSNWLRGDRKNWMGVESDHAAAAILSRLSDLRGKDLACWCALDQPCHADVLLRLANGEGER